MQLFTLSAPKYKDQPEGRPKSRFHTSGYSLFADPGPEDPQPQFLQGEQVLKCLF
jgi:hypothetical protein